MNLVTYRGTTSKQVFLEAICDQAIEMQASDYFTKYDDKLAIPGVDWNNCPCIQKGGTEICCVIAIKKV